MVKVIEYVLSVVRGPREVVLPPGSYTTKVRSVTTDPATGKVTITFGDLKPDTTPRRPRGIMRRLARRKDDR